MRSVRLRLEGPLQSWGTQSRFEHRDTDAEPSKSAVLGLVGAALGMPRDDTDTLAQLRSLRMAVRVDREGAMLRDYHTASPPSRLDLKKPHLEGTVLTERFYLTDASFVVALGSDDHALVERVAGALESPRWPLFLGRKSCPPAVPVASIDPLVVDAAPGDAVASVPWAAPGSRDKPAQLRLVLEATPSDGLPRLDEPLSFTLYQRRFAERWIKTAWLPTADLPPRKDADDVSIAPSSQSALA